MRDILQKLLATNNSKERTKLLEKFREFQFGSDREEIKIISFEVFKEAKQMLETARTNEEKRIALRVLGAIYCVYPWENMAEMFGCKSKETPVKNSEIIDIIDICLELLENEDGNLRLSAAYLIDHLRGHISDYDYVDLFYNLLSLSNSPKNHGRNKKTIEFCLDKIFCPFLEASIEDRTPLEIKRMKITVHSQDQNFVNTGKEVENLANKMIEETEKYIKKVLSLRGEHLFEGNFIPYIENVGLLQIFYELQRLKELYFSKEINQELMKNYLKGRISILVKNRIDLLNDLQGREEFSLVLIGPDKTFYIKNLEEAYNNLMKANSAIENLNFNNLA